MSFDLSKKKSKTETETETDTEEERERVNNCIVSTKNQQVRKNKLYGPKEDWSKLLH